VPEIRIKVAVSDPDEETLARRRKIIDELKMRADFPTIGGEVSGEGPVWQYTYIFGEREPMLRLLRRELNSIDSDWPGLLALG
jgi:hypothetical protein